MLSCGAVAVHAALAWPCFMMPVNIFDTVMVCGTVFGGVASKVAYLRYVEKSRTARFDSMGMPRCMSVEWGNSIE